MITANQTGCSANKVRKIGDQSQSEWMFCYQSVKNMSEPTRIDVLRSDDEECVVRANQNGCSVIKLGGMCGQAQSEWMF